MYGREKLADASFIRLHGAAGNMGTRNKAISREEFSSLVLDDLLNVKLDA